MLTELHEYLVNDFILLHVIVKQTFFYHDFYLASAGRFLDTENFVVPRTVSRLSVSM